jgi:hypothetical protein
MNTNSGIRGISNVHFKQSQEYREQIDGGAYHEFRIQIQYLLPGNVV